LQRLLFGALAQVARVLGYKGSYPEYLEREPPERVEVEPWTTRSRGRSVPSTRVALRPTDFASNP
jgi:hypothetical protein